MTALEKGLGLPLGTLGPFFALHGVEATRDGRHWERVASSALTRQGMRHHTRATAGQLAVMASGGGGAGGVDPAGGSRPVPRLAAAALSHLGMTARLLSPWIGIHALAGELLVPEVDELWWVPGPGSMFPLAGDALPCPGGLASWARRLSDELIRPLTHHSGLPATIAWGNTASALNGAVRAVTAAGQGEEVIARTRGAAIALAATIPQPHAWSGQLGDASFRRRSCCQLWRLAGDEPAPVCGDCVLGHAAR